MPSPQTPVRSPEAPVRRLPDIRRRLHCASYQAGAWPQARISQDAAGKDMYETCSHLAYGQCVLADAILAWAAALEGALGGQPCVPSNPPAAGDMSNSSLDLEEIPDFTDLGDMSEMGLSQLAWPLGLSGEGDSLPSSRPISYDEKDILSSLETPDSWSAMIQDAIQPGATPRPAKNVMPRPDTITRPNSGPQTPANTDDSSSPGCSPDVTIPSLVQSDL